MGSVWKDRISVSISGESHGTALCVTLDNLPHGYYIDNDKIKACLDRRSPSGEYATGRKESDKYEIISGIYKDMTTGAPLTALIQNKDVNSSAYDDLKNLARPGHADYSAHLKYDGFNDPRGGGHFSGRITAALVIAGSICSQILENKGIHTGAHIYSIQFVKDKPFSDCKITEDLLRTLKIADMPVIDLNITVDMVNAMTAVARSGDSIGGIIECAVINLPAGIGSPIFDGLENQIAAMAFAIGGIKGIEFGAGFSAATMTGSENNDSFYMEDGKIRTNGNNHGGVLGGITTGEPLTFKVAVKPVPSISLEQSTVDFVNMTNERIAVKGRHDSCIVPRAVVCVESIASIAALNQCVSHGLFN